MNLALLTIHFRYAPHTTHPAIVNAGSIALESYYSLLLISDPRQ